MKTLRFLLAIALIALLPKPAFGNDVVIGTMNCRWFFADKHLPKDVERLSPSDYTLKAGHLIGLLPKDAPLLLGLEEVGDENDVRALAHAATARYHHAYEVCFVPGRDSATGQNVAAIVQTDTGWGIYGRPARHADLEYTVSKHITLVLTNHTGTRITACIVHLRRPIGEEGQKKQHERITALLRWSMRHLANNPKANVMILGDFNESGAPNSTDQGIYPLLSQARPPFQDILTFSKSANLKTHPSGSFDRILVSAAIADGQNGLSVSGIYIGRHSHSKDPTYTDHFPLIGYFAAN